MRVRTALKSSKMPFSAGNGNTFLEEQKHYPITMFEVFYFRRFNVRETFFGDSYRQNWKSIKILVHLPSKVILSFRKRIKCNTIVIQ